ncbi:hypothetical protein EDC96DRAFT_542197 [Choanephora cucurbitarum]|nr:hypothetical protein EDC96DRAFT_542197 [Choanephora cucurbitarum]
MADGDKTLIDLDSLESLQEKAKELSQRFVDQVEHIQQQMRQMSSSTMEAGKLYTLSVKNLAEEIDSSFKKTTELITHCDELDKDLAQLQILSRQVKAVDKGLDRLQAVLSAKRS